MKIEKGLTTQNFADLVAPTGNVYASTVTIAKKAKQLASVLKTELDGKLTEFDLHKEDGSEEFSENKEHIEISKFYEKKPKPIVSATREFLDGNVKSYIPE